MRALTKRGMRLKSKLERLGTKVIETYPGAIYDILGINRKKPQRLGNSSNSTQREKALTKSMR